MSICSELTVYKVAKVNIPRVIELSLSIIAEMNANENVITSHKILQRTDNEEELCWYLTWVSEEAVKLNEEKWPSLPSSSELMSLVDSKVYYGHFISVF
jgi:hypothetical protein